MVHKVFRDRLQQECAFVKRHVAEGRSAALACVAVRGAKVHATGGQAGDRCAVDGAGEHASVALTGKPLVFDKALEFQGILRSPVIQD